jgi:hypothetical protein
MTTSPRSEWRPTRPFEPSPTTLATRRVVADLLRAEGFEIFDAARARTWSKALYRAQHHRQQSLADFLVARKVEPVVGGAVVLVRVVPLSESRGRGVWQPGRKAIERLHIKPGSAKDPELGREVELRLEVWVEHGLHEVSEHVKGCREMGLTHLHCRSVSDEPRHFHRLRMEPKLTLEEDLERAWLDNADLQREKPEWRARAAEARRKAAGHVAPPGWEPTEEEQQWTVVPYGTTGGSSP